MDMNHDHNEQLVPYADQNDNPGSQSNGNCIFAVCTLVAAAILVVIFLAQGESGSDSPVRRDPNLMGPEWATWEHVKGMIDANLVYHENRLCRSPKTQALYHDEKRRKTKPGGGMKDYSPRAGFIKVQEMGWEKYLHSRGKFGAKPQPNCLKSRLMKNKFPYSLYDEDVIHYVYWNTTFQTGPKAPPQVHKVKDKILDALNIPRDSGDVLVFENTNRLKSIPNLWHCHVLVRCEHTPQKAPDDITKKFGETYMFELL